MERSVKRLLIADDHPIFREGVVRIVGRDPSFTIVAQCGDGAEALQLIREAHPDIAVLDVSMPLMSGLDVARAATQERLAVDFVILTMYADEGYFDKAMELGVKGYILKDSIASELLTGLKSVVQGRYFISPTISDLLVDRKKRAQALAKKEPRLNDLTPAERQIVQLLAENKTSRQIAETLFISIRTVENHRAHICGKLALKGQNSLLRFAIENKTYL